jgi:pilus assembly protein CpaC
MRRIIPYIFLLSVIFMSQLGGARVAFADPQDLGPATSRLTLEIGKGRLIRLDGAVKSVFVADPRIADIDVKSPSLVYVTAKAAGATSLFAIDRFEQVLANIEIQSVYDEDQLRADLKRLLPGSAVEVSTSNSMLVLTGSARSAADAEVARTLALRYAPDVQHLLDRTSVDEPNQVNLRVRVAEVSRDLVKSFGFNWAVSAHSGQGVFGFSTGTGAFTNNISSGSTGSSGTSSATTTALSGSGNILLGLASQGLDVQLLIDALDTEGLVKILAEPNLTAVSGAPATFLAGGEYPIPVPQSLGVTTIQYKDYGVSLNFLATITDGGRINLLVKPEVSQLSTQGAITLNGVTVPALTIRRAQTTVDLGSGQSFAIAGLLQNNINQTITRFPGLGNVPILGALFRSDSFERDETELVIIVTPYVVRPVSGRLATPSDGYVAPTDSQRLFLGADSSPQPAHPGLPLARAGTGLIGPGGFELE